LLAFCLVRGHGSQRQDLQGLRAIAVLLVALNHARIKQLAGGFVGVDVFFVMSGFFITGQLLREGFNRSSGMSNDGVSIRQFYFRRARRILPAALLTLFAVNVAVYYVYNYVRADQILHDSWAATLFVANIHFAQASTDYFAQAQGVTSPVQHFWSLSVEEQFYVVWPALLALAFGGIHRAIYRRGETRVAERTIWVLLGVIFAGSLAFSIHGTSTSPQSTYFSTVARAWELALGAIVALAARRVQNLPPRASAAASVVGIAMIVVAALAYTSKTPFPGAAALLPTVGSALVIFASFTPRLHGASRVLSWQPLPFIGDRSYTFYLWHFPAVVIVAEAAGHELSVGQNLLVLLGAFGLSCVTYQFYENPLRYLRWTPQRSAWALTAAFCAIVLSLSFALGSVRDQKAQSIAAVQSKNIAALTDNTPVASDTSDSLPNASGAQAPAPISAVIAAAAHPNQKIPGNLAPPVSELQHDSWFPPGGCMPGTNGTTSNVCKLGDQGAHKTLVVLGDSHAKMWMPAVLAAAAKAHYTVVPLLHLGCLPERLHSPQFHCDTWYSWAAKQARKLHPAATLVSFRYGFHQGGSKDAATLSALGDVLKTLPKSVLIEDPPEQHQQPVECLLKSGATMGSCTTQRAQDNLDAAATVAAGVRSTVLPTTQWFCTADGKCPTVINGTAAFQDIDHVSKTYADELGPLFAKQLKRTLRAARA
jgi:peptidoglycan/LPS O-acetylase OafA/YrhL